ncbi:MAG: TetR/AcrR family transcriptional regulator [Bdellovibrionales bacterium]|nr:TetR/AcrR family transcriptional regulator [Bdellovibrionales bacterium]
MTEKSKAKSAKSGKKNPTQARSVKTVDAILEASIRILRKFGPDGFNTNRIAEIAGVSVGSVYQFFGNKNVILDEVFTRFITESSRQVVETIFREEGGDLKAVIRRVIEGIFDRFEAQNILSAKVVQNVIQTGGLDRFKKEEDRLSKLILEGLNQHGISIGPKNPEQALRICIQAVRVMVTSYFVNPDHYDRQVVIDEVCDLLYQYLKPRN